MTVRKGEPWGESAKMPSGTPVANTDAMASRLFQVGRSQGKAKIEIGLTGGDLWRTLGAPVGGAERLRSGACTRAVVDVGWADLGQFGGHSFVAHCFARTRTWSRFAMAMNAEWLGAWDVAPRSHPGDGKFDVLEGELQLQDLLPVRARVLTGSHLPHPSIKTRRTDEASFEFETPMRMWLDGAPFPRLSAFSVWMEPGSLTVYV